MAKQQSPRSTCTLSEAQCLSFLRKFSPGVDAEHWKATDAEDVIQFYGVFLQACAQHTKRLNESLVKKCVMEWAGVDALTATKVASSLCLAFSYCKEKKKGMTSGVKAQSSYSPQILMVIEAMQKFDAQTSPVKDAQPVAPPIMKSALLPVRTSEQGRSFLDKLQAAADIFGDDVSSSGGGGAASSSSAGDEIRAAFGLSPMQPKRRKTHHADDDAAELVLSSQEVLYVLRIKTNVFHSCKQTL